MPLAELHARVFSQQIVVHDDKPSRVAYKQEFGPISGFVTSGSGALIPPPLDDPFRRTVFSTQSFAVSSFQTGGSATFAPGFYDPPPSPIPGMLTVLQRAYAVWLTAWQGRSAGEQGGSVIATLPADDPYTRIPRPAPFVRKVSWWDEFLQQVAFGPAVDDPYTRYTRPAVFLPKVRWTDEQAIFSIPVDDPYVSPLRPAPFVRKQAWWTEFLQQVALMAPLDDLPSPATWSGVATTRSTIAYSTYLNTEWRKRLDAQNWFSQVALAPAVIDDLYHKIVFSAQNVAVSGFTATGGAVQIPSVPSDEPSLRIPKRVPSIPKTRWLDEFFQQIALPPAVVDPYLGVARPNAAIQKRTWWDDSIQPLPTLFVDDPYARIVRAAASTQKRVWWDEFLQQTAVTVPPADDVYRKIVFGMPLIAVSGFASAGGATQPALPLVLDDPPRRRMFASDMWFVSGFASSGAAGVAELPLPLDDSGIRVITFRLPYRVRQWTADVLSPTAGLLLVSDDALPRPVSLVRPMPFRQPYLVQEIFPVLAGPIPDDPARRAVIVSALVAVSGFATSGAAGPLPTSFVVDDSVLRMKSVLPMYKVWRWADEVGRLSPPTPVPGTDDFLRRVTFAAMRPLTIQRWAMLEGFPGELVPPDDPFMFILSAVVSQPMPWEGTAEAVTLSTVVPLLTESVIRWPQTRTPLRIVMPDPTVGLGISAQGSADDPVRQWPTRGVPRPVRWLDEPIFVAPVVPPVPAESLFRVPSPLWVPPSRRIWVPDDFIIIPVIVPPQIGELCVEVSDTAARCELFSSAARAEIGTTSAQVELQTNLCRAGHRPQF